MKITIALAFAGALFASALHPARADGGVSLGLGEHFVFRSNGAGSTGTMTDISGTYDVGPHVPIVPIRANLQFDYASGGGNQRFAGGGIGARLTTPLYAGVGLGIFNVTGGSAATNANVSATGFGSDIVVGSQLLGIPGGARLDLEAGFKQLPTAQGLDLSGATLGLRLRF